MVTGFIRLDVEWLKTSANNKLADVDLLVSVKAQQYWVPAGMSDILLGIKKGSLNAQSSS